VSIDFDFSELDKLAADLGKVPDDAGKKIRQAVEVTSRHIKDEWAKKLEGENGVPHAPRSITYDIEAKPGRTSQIKAEIGAQRGRLQAPIVTVLEFGAPGNNLPPRGYGHAALQENEADFIKGLEIATEIVL
jgi:hypothetical protein